MKKLLVILLLLTVLVELEAQKASSIASKGIKYLEKKDYANAVEQFTKFIAKEPSCDSGYYYRGVCLFYMNNNNGAITDITKAIKINPNYTKAYYFRGQIYSRLGNSHEAMKDFSQVVLLDPKTTNAYFSLGIEANKLKRYEDGRDYFTKVIELSKDSKDAYKHRGFSYYMLKSDKLAIDDCNKAEEMGVTEDPWLYKNRGLAKTEIGDFDGAIADFNKSIALKKNNYDLAFKGRAKAYAGKQQWRNSMDDYTRFMEKKYKQMKHP
jgi:tetratricopeptide (TPR) repeat protein